MAASNQDALIAELQRKVAELETTVKQREMQYYAARDSRAMVCHTGDPCFPEGGIPASYAKTIIQDYHHMDSNERLNTSSYVNVVFEPEEAAVAQLGMGINIADQTVYPVTFKVHDHVVNMMANLWHCPPSDVFNEMGVHAGAGTVGSTEACLLAGLALKFRWRRWYAAKHNLSHDEVRKVYPNIVMSDMYQAAWEKLFKYMDIEPRLCKSSYKSMILDPSEAEKLIDDKTIGVVCIMGNHYSGHYDPVEEVNEMLTRVNKEKGFQVGIHVDGASGGFVAPFQPEMHDVKWDFRSENVLSISASGHKFGESVCGTGWVVWRQREDLSEHVAISVTYLGGNADSYTLNFSRPASGILVQFYKILRLGRYGYTSKVANQMQTTIAIRNGLRSMKLNGKDRFVLLDNGDSGCLPVVTAMLNPALNLPYDDIDLQHAIADEHWYVSGYSMQYHCPMAEEITPLFTDIDGEQTMFRIVVKSNLTMEMGISLVEVIGRAVAWLDQHIGDDEDAPVAQPSITIKDDRAVSGGKMKGGAPSLKFRRTTTAAPGGPDFGTRTSLGFARMSRQGSGAFRTKHGHQAC